LLTLGGKRVYISGDTACIPEMKALTDIDIAFVTMNLPYTMPPEEAAECVAAFKPKIVYPYHYRGSDLNVFTRVLESHPDIEVRIRDWY
jgi:L-ascorbate metabolism protein UlaG (beta-lactamase superfamily)